MPTYAPNLVYLPCKTGTGVVVNVPDAAEWGRRFIPQPFQAAGIISPELWGDFTFPPAFKGVYYEFQWYCENQNLPIVFSLVSGSLPPGLVLSNIGSTARGMVNGTPTTVGSYSFTLLATGPTNSGTKAFVIVVNLSPVTGGAAGFVGGG